jgi:hypothetical protein
MPEKKRGIQDRAPISTRRISTRVLTVDKSFPTVPCEKNRALWCPSMPSKRVHSGTCSLRHRDAARRVMEFTPPLRAD